MNPAFMLGLANLLQQRRPGGMPGAAQGAPVGAQPPDDPFAALADDANPIRVPTMRAEDPDFLKYQLAPLDEENQALQAQLQQAEALMKGSGRQYTTPLGAGIGGLADVLRMGVGAYRQQGLQKQMGELGTRRAAAVEALGRNPSESAVQRDESRRGRLLQRAMQANQQTFQAGQQTERLGAEAQRAKDAAAAKAKGDITEQETGIRKELMNNQIVKDYQLSLVARDGLKEAAKDPSPAGDLAIVFGTMQTLDPGSVVKENEQIQVRNAANLSDRALNYIARVNSGELLTAKQRKELIDMANGQVRARAGVVREIFAGYEPIVQRGGLNRGNVFPLNLDDSGASTAPQTAQPATGALPPAPGGVVGPGDPRNVQQKITKDGKTYTLRGDGNWYEE